MLNDLSTLRDLPTSEKVRLLWGFYWRGLIITLVSMIGGLLAGAILGLVLGLVLALIGVDVREHLFKFKIIGFLAGSLVGTLFFIVYIHWLFRARFGDYSLVLRKEVASRGSSSGSTTRQPDRALSDAATGNGVGGG